MHIRKTLIAVAVTTAALTANGVFAAPDVKMSDTAIGSVLTDANGMTLYIFDKDEAGKSNCYDACATNWPPLFADEGAMAEGDYTIVERTDGTAQWAYKGQPLYYWINDAAPGDTTGDGVNGVWHVVK
jgi:predicted lipoprotein with Yx(FWY)xxD motif